MLRNRKSIILAIVLVLASLGLAAFMLQPSAKDLLVDSIETMQTVTDGHAVIEFELTTPEESGSGAAEVWGMLDAGPNGEPAFRIEVMESSLEHGVGMTAVSDGVQFWVYNPEENSVLTGTFAEMAALMAEKWDGQAHPETFAPEFEEFDDEEMTVPETPEEAVEQLLVYFDAERVGFTSEDVAGVPAYHLRLIPIPEQMPEEVRAAGGLLNVWIAVESKAPLALSYTGGNMGSGQIAATVLEFNQGVDESVFTFEIPAGAEVINVEELEPEMFTPAETAALDLLMPADLPADARLVETVEVRGSWVQRYTFPDGATFTVAQGQTDVDYAPEGATAETVTVRDVEGQLFTDAENGRTLLTWREGDLQLWIGGDLTSDQALAVAESLQ